MYHPPLATGKLTFVSRVSFPTVFLLLLSTVLQPVLCRDLHTNFLAARLKRPLQPDAPLQNDVDRPSTGALYSTWDELDEWAGVQGSWESILKPSRQMIHLEPTPSSNGLGQPFITITPTQIPLLDQQRKLYARALFTSNVCPISTQTTVFISVVDGSSAITLSTQVGPRPTGIPGDAGTSDGNDTGGGNTDDNPSSGRGLSDKEGLITGIVVVVAVLLASLCALLTYFYRKRKRSINRRKPSGASSDTVEIVRQMGSKGFQTLGNPVQDVPTLPPQNTSKWTPFRNFFGPWPATRGTRRPESLDSNELRERKTPPELAQISQDPSFLTDLPFQKRSRSTSRDSSNRNQRASSQLIPQIISTPVPSVRDSLVRPPTPKHDEANPSPRSSLNPDYVPLVSKRVSQANAPPIPRGPVVIYSTPEPTRSNLRYETYPPRVSQEEPLTPSGWMRGYGLSSTGNVDPFLNPASATPSDGTKTFDTQTHSRMNSRSAEGPASPLSQYSSGEATRVPTENLEHRNAPRLTLFTDVSQSQMDQSRDDGASEILMTLGSAFGDKDRPGSQDSHLTFVEESHAKTRDRRFTMLSDVEEVLTPIADERQYPRSHFSPASRYGPHPPLADVIILNSVKSSPSQESVGRNGTQQDAQNPFGEEAVVPTAWSRRRPSIHTRQDSEMTSVNGERSNRSNSHSGSVTGTSIVDAPTAIDSGEWDDASIRRREEAGLFFSGALRGSPRSQNSAGGQGRTTSRLS